MAFASEVRTIGMECSRFGWGAIERGPVRFVVEYQNNFKTPAKCRAGSTSQSWVINSIWVNDADVATRLAATEGLPVQFAAIDLSGESVGTAFHGKATWGTPASTVEVYQESGPTEPAVLGAAGRFYWKNSAAGVSSIEFGGDGVKGPTYPSERPVTGTMSPPMLMSAFPAYSGAGFAFAAGQFGGEIARFRDLLCESPLP
jgi:hypothetical protein